MFKTLVPVQTPALLEQNPLSLTQLLFRFFWPQAPRVDAPGPAVGALHPLQDGREEGAPRLEDHQPHGGPELPAPLPRMRPMRGAVAGRRRGWAEAGPKPFRLSQRLLHEELVGEMETQTNKPRSSKAKDAKKEERLVGEMKKPDHQTLKG